MITQKQNKDVFKVIDNKIMFNLYNVENKKWMTGTYVSMGGKYITPMFDTRRRYATGFSCIKDANAMADRFGLIVVEDNEVVIRIDSYDIVAARDYDIKVPEYVAVPFRKVEDKDYISELVSDASSSDTNDWVEFAVLVDWYEVVA